MEIYARVLQCTGPGWSPEGSYGCGSPGRGGSSPAWSSPRALLPPASPPTAIEAPASPNSFQSVQVKIELGHRATTRKRKTHEGFTHDWAVFVRGPEGSNIQHFVEKVVFHLHDSFPKPKRVLKEPPYQVAESGYAGFNLNIEIFFKNKEEPRKILFSYDLFLHAEGFPPVNHIRCEKLTFKNPTEEFRRKLIKAGGIGVLGPEDHAQFQQPAAPQSMSPPPSGNVAKPQTPEAAGKTLPEQATKSDSGKKPKLASSTSSSSSKPASIYGSGSIGSKPKSTSVAASAANSTPKTQSSIHSSSTVSPPSMKEHKEHSKSSHRDKEKDKLKVKEKSGVKRQTESGHDSAKKKRKESTETKSREKEKERDREKEREKHKSKSSKDAKESKSKSSSSSSKKESSKNRHETDSKSTSKSAPSSNSKAKNEVNGKSSAASFSAKSNSDLFDDELSLSSDNSDVEITEGPVPGSPESSLSFSSMKAGSGTGTGALSTLWAEIDETVGNEEDEMLSPLPRNSPPSLFSQSIPTPPVFEKPPSVEKKETSDSKKNSSPQSSSSSQKSKSRRKEKESSTSIKSSKSERKSNKDSKDRRRSKETKENKPRETSWHQDSQQVAQNGKDLEEEDMDIEIGESHEINSIHDLTERDLNGEKAPNGEFLTVLCELQEQLMSMTDRGLLARVVKVIEQTGKYKINEATFDFDLCSLDADTVLRLKKCLKQS